MTSAAAAAPPAQQQRPVDAREKGQAGRAAIAGRIRHRDERSHDLPVVLQDVSAGHFGGRELLTYLISLAGNYHPAGRIRQGETSPAEVRLASRGRRGLGHRLELDAIPTAVGGIVVQQKGLKGNSPVVEDEAAELARGVDGEDHFVSRMILSVA